MFTSPSLWLDLVLGGLSFLSVALLLWQWFVASRFPLHRRTLPSPDHPGISLLKPLKGCEQSTEECLRSWFAQDYQGPVELLFGVQSPEDPACAVVARLIECHPHRDARLVICGEPSGMNAKVSKLVQLESQALHDLFVVSDADTKVPPDLLTQTVALITRPRAGLVHCFYRLANPSTPAMLWEAVAVNADFWSQVLQAHSLRRVDFALGAVMMIPRAALRRIGGFSPLRDCLADDYQLGNRIAHAGYNILLSSIVVECWSEPMSWRAVWKHQLRWARTIRVCQPVPYFFSILSNATFCPLLWLLVHPCRQSGAVAFLAAVTRIVSGRLLQRWLGANSPPFPLVMPLVKDLLQVPVWAMAFVGNQVEWRGARMRVRSGGTLVAASDAPPPQRESSG